MPLRARMGTAAALAAALLLAAAPAAAKIYKLKGLHDDHERIEPLIDLVPAELETPARIFAVIGGDYGFTILDGAGRPIMVFENSKDAVGTVLQPGTYSALPSIEDDLHHHQFIEVLLKSQ